VIAQAHVLIKKRILKITKKIYLLFLGIIIIYWDYVTFLKTPVL